MSLIRCRQLSRRSQGDAAVLKPDLHSLNSARSLWGADRWLPNRRLDARSCELHRTADEISSTSSDAETSSGSTIGD